MPLLGYALGSTMLHWLAESASWIVFLILVVLGLKTLYESRSYNEDNTLITLNHRALVYIAIATSIDAIAAGFTLNLLSFNAYVACLVIAITTGFLSFWRLCRPSFRELVRQFG